MACRLAGGIGPWSRSFITLTMAALDGAFVNIALPTIALDVNRSPAEVVWVANIYQVAVVTSLLPLAALGEIVGFRRAYVGGVFVFTLASLCCALSGSLPELMVARGLQGLSAGGIMSIGPAIIRFIYPKQLLGRGYGYNALSFATASALGPSVEATILMLGPWNWLFAANYLLAPPR